MPISSRLCNSFLDFWSNHILFCKGLEFNGNVEAVEIEPEIGFVIRFDLSSFIEIWDRYSYILEQVMTFAELPYRTFINYPS